MGRRGDGVDEQVVVIRLEKAGILSLVVAGSSHSGLVHLVHSHVSDWPFSSFSAFTLLPLDVWCP